MTMVDDVVAIVGSHSSPFCLGIGPRNRQNIAKQSKRERIHATEKKTLIFKDDPTSYQHQDCN